MASLNRRIRTWRQQAPLFTITFVLLFVGLTAVGAAARDGHKAAPAAEASGVRLLRSEIDATVASGVAPWDPKVLMLQADLVGLTFGAHVTPPPEPGVNLSHPRGDAELEAERRNTALWDTGEVMCEPIPPDLLTPAEIVDATCTGTPQADGSTLYVATRADGTQHVVRFAADGNVTRER